MSSSIEAPRLDPAVLRDRVSTRTATIAVIGCGYVGLPLSMAFAKAGFTVIGIDTDERKVESLARGTSYILDIADEVLRAQLAAGRFRATTDADVLRDADVIFVSVPTPFDRAKQPDLTCVRAAAEAIASRLRRGQLVILESTTFPGTTEEVLRPILERSGLRASVDFLLAFSPERIDPGNRRFTIANTPKVVGGVDAASTAAAVHVLEQIITAEKVHPVSSPQAAELTKLLENTFRAVNIALVNELAMLCDRMGIDIWEVIDAAATKPYGFMPFYPGPGVGGHCLATGEWIYVRNGRRVGVRTVDDLWREAAAAGTVERLDGAELVPSPELQVVGIGIDGPAAWEGVSHLFRRPFRGDLIEIVTADGRRVVATDEHPFLVVDERGVRTRPASAVAPGDLLPLFTEGSFASAEGDPVIDLIVHLSMTQKARTRVRVIGGSWSEHATLLRSRFGPARARDWIRGDYLPLDRYLELEAAGSEIPSRDRLVLWTGRGPAQSSLAAVIRLSPDTARLLGYYVAEGCITVERDAARVRFTFHPEETETIRDLQALLAALGLRYSVSRDRKAAALHVKVSSNLFTAFIRDALGCGVNSYDAAVPEVVLGSSEAHRLELLTGLLRGDGSVDARSGSRTYRKNGKSYVNRDASASLSFWTSSPTLERQMTYLLQSLGIRSSIQRHAVQPGADIHLLGVDTVVRLAPLFADAKRARLERCLREKVRWPRSPGVLRAAGQTVVPVKTVTRRPSDTAVYSIETELTHTFATGHGIFVHNCIPVDPFYLSFKAREFDFHTKFIELAAETNLEMPFFTASRIRAFMGEDGKALRGARVLVLGASFKSDIDDARNSSAVRVMKILRNEGAELSYHDPHVDRVHLSGSLFAADEEGTELRSIALTPERLASSDCVAILVGHSAVDYDLVVKHAPRVFDAVNATRGRSGRARLERL